MGSYVKLLGNLVSAHSNYMDLIVNMLVQHLVWGKSIISLIYSDEGENIGTERVSEHRSFISAFLPTWCFS